MDDILRWKCKLQGEIYNDPESLNFFRVPLPMFLAFARILHQCPSFQCNDLKQCKYFSHKLHLLVTMKNFGAKRKSVLLSVLKMVWVLVRGLDKLCCSYCCSNFITGKEKHILA